MLDINLIRSDAKLVKRNCENRGYDKKIIEEILNFDKKWRKLKFEKDKIRSERNKISKEISKSKKNKDEKKAKQLMKQAKEIPKKLKSIDDKEKEIKEKIDLQLSLLPNIQEKDVPVGGEEKNKVLKKWGKLPKFNFPIKPHQELLENLNLLDMKRAAKISGSGFYLFKGKLAQLERALINFMLDFHAKNNFTEVNVPHLTNSKSLFGTGQLPKFEEDLYKTNENLYLIPTAEVSLTNLYSGEILKEKELPKKFVSFTQCYRTEAGRHGSETPGIFRLHQFEKVEMVCICKKEDSWKFFEEITLHAEKIIQALELPYRKVLLATKDASFPSAKTIDLEVWSPAMKKYLEVSSISNCTDFQARRMNTRYQEKNKLNFIHTINASGLATPRIIISLVENFQQKDGSIKIPKVLWPYMSGEKIIKHEK